MHLRRNWDPWTTSDSSGSLSCTALWSCGRQWPRPSRPISCRRPLHQKQVNGGTSQSSRVPDLAPVS
jgi:hypothetical protein